MVCKSETGAGSTDSSLGEVPVKNLDVQSLPSKDTLVQSNQVVVTFSEFNMFKQ